ncbi:hypothetical protein V8E54_003825 [Elaphomyces granulatus]
MDKYEIKESLEQVFSDIKHPGSFLTSTSFKGGINPGLEVSGAGPISLPLSAEVAKKIIQASHVSPYGKGSETLVNESVRKTWELNTDQFSLRNPEWSSQLEELLQAAVSGLGLMAEPAEIKAELYKLLVYEEGAFFLPHQDSEKVDGMFGTLVVSLPSKHEGGDVVATHKGESLTFRSSPGSDFGFSYAAWYSDVSHEVKAVTSGYRLVLTYNLIHRPSTMSLENRDNISAKLVSLLQSWTDLCPSSDSAGELVECKMDDDDGPALLYILDHQYTSAELSFTRLKGVDQGRVAEAWKACKKTGFSLFLTSVERTESGDVREWQYCQKCGCDHNCSRHRLSERDETLIVLSNIVDPQGCTSFAEINCNDAALIQEDPFFDHDPDEEDYKGFTGNEGATATHVYRLTGLLIIPPSFRLPGSC